MPCGGIFPVYTNGAVIDEPCWFCNKRGCDLMCMEWDSVIHSGCVPKFLESEEGQIILNHGHQVIILKDGQPFTLHEGT
jgi:hypothetical protein